MNIPCVKQIPFIISGLSFLQAALTPIQFNNMTLIATALILGSKFNLTEISRMYLSKKCVSTLSHFLSDAKFNTWEMQELYILKVIHLYKIKGGYFIIDDTMQHHSNFCKCIHGVCVLFDHALKTNLKAICVVVLYYSDGNLIKFPITFRIYYQKKSKLKKFMPWMRNKEFVYKTKYELAIEMIEWAMEKGFPGCTVLADSWFGIGPFIKELRRLKLSYVLEIRNSYNIRTPCNSPKLTPTGKLSKDQHDLTNISEYFLKKSHIAKYGFAPDKEKGKAKKVLYHAKTVNVHLNSIPGKHRIIESTDPAIKTVKYLLTNELTWEASKILTVYSYRWVIEEFFRNAKQLSGMESVTIRSEQGVTTALLLVFWIDFLLHHENYKQSISGELPKVSLTIPSIIRRAQYENMGAFIEKVQNEDDFIAKWTDVERKRIDRNRKCFKPLVDIDKCNDVELDVAV
jgi:SRSO17 transposase